MSPGSTPASVLAADFADWRADRLTREDGSPSAQALERLVQRGEELLQSSPKDPELAGILGQLYRAELDQLARAQGPWALARRMARLADDALSGLRSSEASPWERARATAIAQALRPGEISASLAELGQGAPGEGGEDLLALAVQEALAAGQPEFVAELGPEAAPALAALARQPRELDVATGSEDPLRLLVSVDPTRALDVGLELLARKDDPLVRSRVRRAFAFPSPFVSDSVWTLVHERWQLVRPEWVGVLLELAPQEGVQGIEEHLVEFVRRDDASPQLARLYVEWLLSRPSAPDAEVPKVLAEAARSCLSLDDPQSQRRGIETLRASAHFAPLFARTFSSDPSVREALAPAFLLPEGSQPDTNYESSLEHFLRAVPDGAGASALANSAKTAEAMGRSPLALDALLGLMTPEYLTQPGWSRAWTEHAVLLEESGWLACTQGFASTWRQLESDRQAEACSGFLTAARKQRGPSGLKQGYLALESTGAPGSFAARELGHQLTFVASSHPEALSALGEELLRAQDLDALRNFVEVERRTGGSVVFQPFLDELPIGLSKGLVRALWSLGYDKFSWLGSEELPLTPRDWLDLAAEEDAVEEAAAEPGTSAEAREWHLRQMNASLRKHPERRLQPSDVPEVARAMILAGQPAPGYLDLQNLGLDPEQILRALLDAEAPDAVLEQYYTPLEDQRLLDRVLDRLPPQSWKDASDVWLHRAMMEAMVERHDPALNDDLLQANRPGSLLQQFLIETLANRGSDVHLPVAGAILQSEWFRSQEVRDQAIQLVAGYLSDEAAGYLLEAAKRWRDETGRERLRMALEELLTWQDLQQRWLRGRGQAERRLEAIRELASLLTSAAPVDVERRIAAIQGLAALDAKSELPLLIELADSGNDAVQKAARTALERLSRDQ